MIYNGINKPPLGIKLNRNHRLSKGLVGCWLFNEGMGNKVYDLSGYGNHGTLEGMAFPSTPTSGWNPGKDGVGLTFDGTSAYVNCGNDASLAITGDEVTVELWIKHATTTDLRKILSRNVYNQGTYALDFWADNQLIGWLKTENAFVEQPLVTTTSDVWNHVVMVYDGSYIKGYKDSVLDGSYALTGNLDNSVNVGNVVFGKSDPVFGFFNGSIDGVKIYNRALSALEIQQLYRHPYAMFEVDGSWVLRAGVVKPPLGMNIAAAKLLL